MRATIYEAKELMMQPRSIMVLIAVIVASGVMGLLLGLQLVLMLSLPALVLTGGIIACRISANRLRRSRSAEIFLLIGKFDIIAALLLFGAVMFDQMLLQNAPHLIFIVLMLRFLLIDFQEYRLDQRLATMEPEEVAAFTESSDVVLARLSDSCKTADRVLDRYTRVGEKFHLVMQ